jgi:hypothetical protein
MLFNWESFSLGWINERAVPTKFDRSLTGFGLGGSAMPSPSFLGETPGTRASGGHTSVPAWGDTRGGFAHEFDEGVVI